MSRRGTSFGLRGILETTKVKALEIFLRENRFRHDHWMLDQNFQDYTLSVPEDYSHKTNMLFF